MKTMNMYRKQLKSTIKKFKKEMMNGREWRMRRKRKMK